jgi:N-methylhydantoinase B
MGRNDGFNNGPFPLKLKIEITDENMVCDFTGTHEQLKDLSIYPELVLTAVRAAFKAITTPTLPANNGSFSRVKLICPEKQW